MEKEKEESREEEDTPFSAETNVSDLVKTEHWNS